MYVDAHNLFSDAQAVTATAASTNLIDIGSARDIGVGETLYLVSSIDVDMTDASSDSTLAVTLETDDNAGFSSATTIATIGTFAALSVAGTRIVIKLPPDVGYEQFIRVLYTPANGNLTTGSFTTFLTTDLQAFTPYPIGYTVS